MSGLDDLVVVEIAGSTAGGLTATLLADRGAEVICIEPDGGSAVRSDEAVWAAWYSNRSAYLTAGSPEAVDALARADVVIASDAEGSVSVDAGACRPDAVVVRISPFGSTGPYARWRSADIVEQAISGHLYLSGSPEREPLQGPTGQAALAAGIWAAIAAMAALHGRRRNGQGQRLEVTHHEALAAMHQFTDVRFTHAGDVLRRMGNRFAGPGSPIGMYRASDGWIAFTVATAAHGEVLLAVTGLSDLLDRPDVTSIVDVMVDASILDPALNGWLATQTVDSAVELLQSVRIAVGPVLTMRQLLDDPQLAHRGWWHRLDVGGRALLATGPPARIDTVGWSRTAARGSTAVAATIRSSSPSEPAAAPTGERPLDGMRVLDLTRVWAGPLAARILSDLGADVVMVEAPAARTPRVVPQSYVIASHFYPGDDPGHDPWNRQGFINKFALGKRSIGLDLSTQSSRSAFERLVAVSDVVIENYSPRVMPNLGLGEDRLRACNPRIVYVTMPGYGRTGPAKDYSAYGPVLDSHAGLSTLMGYPDFDAWKCGIAWPDPIGGVHAAFATLVALWVRDRTPERPAATVEVAQFETAVSMIGDRIVRAQIDDADPAIIGNRHPTQAPQGVYRCAGEDRWLALSVGDDGAWAGLCGAIDASPDWIAWDEGTRRARHDVIDEQITEWASRRDPHAAAAALQALGVAGAPVADAADLVQDPHLAAAGFFELLDHPSTGPLLWHRLPIRGSTIQARPRSAAPCLGADNRAVLRTWAGMSERDIDALVEEGVLGDIPPA